MLYDGKEDSGAHEGTKRKRLAAMRTSGWLRACGRCLAIFEEASPLRLRICFLNRQRFSCAQRETSAKACVLCEKNDTFFLVRLSG